MAGRCRTTPARGRRKRQAPGGGNRIRSGAGQNPPRGRKNPPAREGPEESTHFCCVKAPLSAQTMQPSLAGWTVPQTGQVTILLSAAKSFTRSHLGQR